jgi:GNAT superfamily N-acetyltransferase
VVGVLDLGSGAPVVYAIAAHDPATTLDLLDGIAPDLPDHFVITGPVGLADRLGDRFAADWVLPHVKMHLPDGDRLGPADPEVEALPPTAAGEVESLRRTGDDASAFFLPELLATGHYLGLRRDGELVAAAGVHVISPRFGVAAIGNVLTHPAHRRQGLGRRVVTTLSRRLLDEVPTVGLNVGVANTEARALYEELGFVPLVTYDEAELVRGH